MQIERPSGKGAGDENFPVASRLLAPRVRPHVMAFYAFARTIDDIADDPSLTAEEKRARLDRMAAGLEAGNDDRAAETAHRLRASLATTGVNRRHALDLVDAFRQDTRQPRYRDWADLMAYCDRSAAPVGRYLLALHDEDDGLQAASDALCCALQVINHLQDCGEDYRRLDRVYIPEPWIVGAGGSVRDLAQRRSTPGVRAAIDRCLDGVDALLGCSAALAPALISKRLAFEAAAIQRIAEVLSRCLRARDPLAERVVLARPGVAGAAAVGILRMLWRRRPRASAGARRAARS
ncbi:MAG: squalene synthase HpnC [Alphaproteobacteria bacterium]